MGTKDYIRGVMSQKSAAESSPLSSVAVMNELSLHGVDRDSLTSFFPSIIIQFL